MTVESAHLFAVQIKEEFGIDLSKLGCVMAELGPLDLLHYAPEIEKDLYVSPNPDHSWIKGDVASGGAHVTLLYGLLRPAYEYGDLIEHMVADVLPKYVVWGRVGYFESPFPDEPYACIRVEIEKTEALVRTNDRLRYLPHVETFPEWVPHVTLAYVKKGTEKKWVEILTARLEGTRSTIESLNFGSPRS